MAANDGVILSDIAVVAKCSECNMVGGNGLEPMTSAMSTQCSNQLS
jgi:hypothetical protein